MLALRFSTYEFTDEVGTAVLVRMLPDAILQAILVLALLGVIPDDVIRSLCLSQRKLGTREVILVHHTDCGLQTVTEDAFKAELEAELGIKPWWALESFVDPYADVAQSMARLASSPFIPYKDHVSGFVYDVTTGRLNEVAG